MDDNFHPRLKRKGFEGVDHDFSDFPSSSPATKIRRLDADLPPMMILDEEPADQPAEQSCNSWKIEELPNEERAIAIVKSPSNFSVSIHPQFISGLKNHIMRASETNSWRVANDKNDDDDISSSGNGCQAVVPWIPPPPLLSSACRVDSSEMMGEAGMDVEESVNPAPGLPQWQQHCTIVQSPHNTTTPVVWYP